MCSKSTCMVHVYLYVKLWIFKDSLLLCNIFFLLMCNGILLLTEAVCRSIAGKGHLLLDASKTFERISKPLIQQFK